LGPANGPRFGAIRPLLGVVLVVWLVAETRGKTLEELSIEETPPASVE